MIWFVGSARGHYVYVEASVGTYSDLANFASPMIKQAAASCTMTFWYHMYGTSIGELSVYIVNGYRLTKRWTLSGDQGIVFIKFSYVISLKNRLI